MLLKGRPVTKFTQQDINERKVSYRQSGDRPKSWVVRDSFTFTLRLNGTQNEATSPALDEERRFRIVVTYAALNRQNLDEYVRLSPH